MLEKYNERTLLNHWWIQYDRTITNAKRHCKENLEEARMQLIDAIANYNAVISDEIICVFDAYDQSGVEREYMYHGVKTIFTKEKETADSFIERYVYELYDKHTKHITVVTSDMSEQHAIFGSGAYRISSREMCGET